MIEKILTFDVAGREFVEAHLLSVFPEGWFILPSYLVFWTPLIVTWAFLLYFQHPATGGIHLFFLGSSLMMGIQLSRKISDAIVQYLLDKSTDLPLDFLIFIERNNIYVADKVTLALISAFVFFWTNIEVKPKIILSLSFLGMCTMMLSRLTLHKTGILGILVSIFSGIVLGYLLQFVSKKITAIIN